MPPTPLPPPCPASLAHPQAASPVTQASMNHKRAVPISASAFAFSFATPTKRAKISATVGSSAKRKRDQSSLHREADTSARDAHLVTAEKPCADLAGEQADRDGSDSRSSARPEPADAESSKRSRLRTTPFSHVSDTPELPAGACHLPLDTPKRYFRPIGDLSTPYLKLRDGSIQQASDEQDRRRGASVFSISDLATPLKRRSSGSDRPLEDVEQGGIPKTEDGIGGSDLAQGVQGRMLRVRKRVSEMVHDLRLPETILAEVMEEEGIGVSPRKTKGKIYTERGEQPLSKRLASLLSTSASGLVLFYLEAHQTLYPPARMAAGRPPGQGRTPGPFSRADDSTAETAARSLLEHTRAAPVYLSLQKVVDGRTHNVMIWQAEVVRGKAGWVGGSTGRSAGHTTGDSGRDKERPIQAQVEWKDAASVAGQSVSDGDDKGDGKLSSQILVVFRPLPADCPRVGLDPRLLATRGETGKNWAAGIWQPWSEVDMPAMPGLEYSGDEGETAEGNHHANQYARYYAGVGSGSRTDHADGDKEGGDGDAEIEGRQEDEGIYVDLPAAEGRDERAGSAAIGPEGVQYESAGRQVQSIKVLFASRYLIAEEPELCSPIGSVRPRVDARRA